jgi:hypothetical protein
VHPEGHPGTSAGNKMVKSIIIDMLLPANDRRPFEATACRPDVDRADALNEQFTETSLPR